MSKYDNSGMIYKNDRKEQDKHPDIKGKAAIGGREYWVSGWRKNGDKGPFYSLSFEAKEQTRETRKQKASRDEFDDDIGF